VITAVFPVRSAISTTLMLDPPWLPHGPRR
jgi:hypothetical protein